MPEGIEIHDAALDLSEESLAALIAGRGAALRLTRLDLSITPAALNALLAAAAPEGQPAPVVTCEEGGLRVAAGPEGHRAEVEVRAAGFRLLLSADGLRLVSE